MQPPTAAQIQALQRLATFMRPLMGQFTWPDAGAFPYLQRHWPSANEFAVQYVRLCARLRKRADRQPDWYTVTGYHVRPVMLHLAFVRLAANIMKGSNSKFHSKTDVFKISFTLQSFCIEADPSYFRVDVKSIIPTGQLRATTKTSRRRSLPGKPDPVFIRGSLATLMQPADLKGKIVSVLDPVRQVSASAPAASICLDPSWHKPSARKEDEHCWHAAFVLLFCRCVNSASSSCERVGSLLHTLFNSETRMAASRVVNRLRLFEAGVRCTGGDRDEKLVAEISKVLLQGGKHPILSASARHKRRKLDLETTGCLRVQAGAISSDKNTSASGRVLAHARKLRGEYVHSTERLQDFFGAAA